MGRLLLGGAPGADAGRQHLERVGPLSVAQHVDFVHRLLLPRVARDPGDPVGVEEVDLRVVEDREHRDVLLHDDSLSLGQQGHAALGVELGGGLVQKLVVARVGVLAVVVAVARAVEVEEGGGVPVVPEPAGAAGHEVGVLEVLAEDLDLLLLEDDRDAQVLGSAAGNSSLTNLCTTASCFGTTDSKAVDSVDRNVDGNAVAQRA
ncbi:hypothetical protein [Leptolyngbya sp. 7M]|uniref:hypothetical protein n=1 Tax=Leptolyngbya sp. 7M TaxID=2812896 RepID=UPI001B8D1CC1|nr:hypothetical protein [Leptolyngbya sp. 7M]QYO65135.1 hypothetical protein JVX88_37525 [Leptolyngbya sp. 7M]